MISCISLVGTSSSLIQPDNTQFCAQPMFAPSNFDSNISKAHDITDWCTIETGHFSEYSSKWPLQATKNYSLYIYSKMLNVNPDGTMYNTLMFWHLISLNHYSVMQVCDIVVCIIIIWPDCAFCLKQQSYHNEHMFYLWIDWHVSYTSAWNVSIWVALDEWKKGVDVKIRPMCYLN